MLAAAPFAFGLFRDWRGCSSVSLNRVVVDHVSLMHLMTFLMAIPSLMVGLPCFLADLMPVTGLVDASLNTLPCFLAILVTVAFLKVVLSGW